MTTSNAAILALSKGPLRDHLEDWLAKYAYLKDEDPATYRAVYQLIEDFAKFALDYRTFLLDLAASSTVPTSRKMYYEYQITRRLVREWIEIGHVLEQREHERYAGWLKGRDDVAKTLLSASFGPDTNAVIAYMGSSTELRHLPYSRVSIVSVPYDTYENDTEALMSLAHELGHHVWRLILCSEKLPGNPKESISLTAKVVAERVALELGAADEGSVAVGALVYSWMTELFADVFGTYALAMRDDDNPAPDGMTGTRTFVKSYVNLLQGQLEDKKELLVNDGSHPFPYLRPVIRAYVSERLGKGLDILESDDLGWKQFLADLKLKRDKQTVVFAIPSTPIYTKPQNASDANPVVPIEHKHRWKKYTVLLSVVERAVTSVIDEVVLPEVRRLWNSTKFPYQPAFTFERWRQSVLPVGAIPTLEEFLSAAISLQQGMNSAGDSSSGLVCGSHDHTGVDANHTHTCK